MVPAQVPNGKYKIQNINSKKVFTVQYASKDPFAKIIQSENTNTDAQIFTITNISNNVVSIVNTANGLAVGVYDSSKDNKAKIIQNTLWNGNATSNQQFIFVPTGDKWDTFYIFNVNSGKCIDVPGGTKNNIVLEQYQPNSHDNQRFRTIKQ